MTSCVMCGREVHKPKRGPVRKTCSARCRMALSRKRRAELPAIPQQMLGARRWVRADGKRPMAVAGYGASSTDPSTWSAFEDVRAGVGDGFGFMLGGGFGCYDLDYAVEDGRLLPWAAEFVASIPEPVIYTELSQSGRGVHVFVLADESRGSKTDVGGGRVERYTFGRFIRLGEPMKL